MIGQPLPVAIRLYAEDHPALVKTIRQRLETRRDELLRQVILAQDWPDFTQRRGVVAGINEALEYCEQATKEFQR